MTRSQRTRHLFMLVLGAMLLLTGCMKVQMDMTIHEDGTADINLITALSRDVMELDPDAPELSDDELVAGMLEDGEGCEADDSLSALRASDPVPYITDEWVGVSCSVDNVPLDEISEGDGLITQADGITSIALPLDDVNDQIESEVDADAAMGDMEGMEALFEQIMSTFEIAMAVEAPGAVIEHNGTRVEGSTVIWEIDVFADEPLTEMTATWDTSVDPGSGMSTAVIAGAVLAAVALLAAALVMYRRTSGQPSTDID